MQKDRSIANKRAAGHLASNDMTEADASILNSKVASETFVSMHDSIAASIKGDEEVMDVYRIRKIQTVEKHLSKCINIEMLTNQPVSKLYATLSDLIMEQDEEEDETTPVTTTNEQSFMTSQNE